MMLAVAFAALLAFTASATPCAGSTAYDPNGPAPIGGVKFKAGRLNASALFLGYYPLRAGQKVKIVWNMLGAGDFKVVARNGSGTVITPAWGPILHDPGNERGTGFVYPAPGCWDMRVSRGKDHGDLFVIVH